VKLGRLGAGVRAPFVLHALVEHQAEPELTEVVLPDLDPNRLATMTALGASRCASSGAGAAPGERAEYLSLG
jgi:hypothetical protein